MLRWLERMATRMGRMQNTGKQQQQQIDTCKICMLTSFAKMREQQIAAGNEGDKWETWTSSVKQAEGMSFEKQEKVVRQNCNQQTANLFKKVDAAVRSLSDDPRLAELSIQDKLDRLQDQYSSEFAAELRKTVNFTLRKDISTISGAGLGVFVDGSVEPGQLVCWYPGKVFVPEFFKTEDDVNAVFYSAAGELNDMARSRYDGTVLDGSKADSECPNPYALGHLVNHPPSGTKPNVLGVSVDFLDDDALLPEELRYLVPNSYGKKPSYLLHDSNIHMMGIVFMALETISDQELFLNYRLNPNLTLPEWYEPVDIEEDKRRWDAPD